MCLFLLLSCKPYLVANVRARVNMYFPFVQNIVMIRKKKLSSVLVKGLICIFSDSLEKYEKGQ